MEITLIFVSLFWVTWLLAALALNGLSGRGERQQEKAQKFFGRTKTDAGGLVEHTEA